jgi:hypothetical protein
VGLVPAAFFIAATSIGVAVSAMKFPKEGSKWEKASAASGIGGTAGTLTLAGSLFEGFATTLPPTLVTACTTAGAAAITVDTGVNLVNTARATYGFFRASDQGQAAAAAPTRDVEKANEGEKAPLLGAENKAEQGDGKGEVRGRDSSLHDLSQAGGVPHSINADQQGEQPSSWMSRLSEAISECHFC